ncbi:MAG: hypothetical protein R3E66_09190 [bacterium]
MAWRTQAGPEQLHSRERQNREGFGNAVLEDLVGLRFHRSGDVRVIDESGQALRQQLLHAFVANVRAQIVDSLCSEISGISQFSKQL